MENAVHGAPPEIRAMYRSAGPQGERYPPTSCKFLATVAEPEEPLRRFGLRSFPVSGSSTRGAGGGVGRCSRSHSRW